MTGHTPQTKDAKPLQKNSQSMYMLEPATTSSMVQPGHGILLMSSSQVKSQSL